MFNQKEMVSIVLSSVFLGFALSFWYFLSAASGVVDERSYIVIFLIMLVSVFFVLFVNSCAKKIAAYYFNSDINIRLWEIKRWGYKPVHYFGNPLSAGIVLPLMTSFISVGYFVWFAPLVFDIKENKSRVAKKHGANNFYFMNESHVGLIAAFGLLANLFFAYLGYLVGFYEFSRLNLYFAIFNILPFSDLDGTKIIFGNRVLWIIMFVLSLIGVLLALVAI